MVYSLRDMKREMRGDKQKACKKGKIALKMVDLYVEAFKPIENKDSCDLVLGEVVCAH